jgi:hypothetical protein
MTGIWTYARAIALSAGLLIAVAVVLPQRADAGLGTGWKCTQTLFLTSCSPAQ